MSDSPKVSASTAADAATRGSAFMAFMRAYRGALVATLVVVLAFVAVDAWLVAQRAKCQREIARLRGSMTALERQRTDAIVSRETDRLRLAIELVRRQARVEQALHLA